MPLGAPDGKEEIALIYGTRVEIRQPGYPNEDVPDAYAILSERAVDGGARQATTCATEGQVRRERTVLHDDPAGGRRRGQGTMQGR